MTESSGVRRNDTKYRLAAGEAVFGALITIPAPELVEVAARAGFDFVTVDAEHEAIDDAQIVHLIRAAEAYRITPIVRLAADPARILRVLNSGAQGIHVSHCLSPGDVRAVVQWTRFHPLGSRTFFNLGRSGPYSLGDADPKWAVEANRQLLVTAMVEDMEAVACLDDILSVEGFDVVHIGPKDLWQSMGMPDVADVDLVVTDIMRRTSAAGRYVSLQFRVSDELADVVARRVADGALMFSFPLLDFILMRAPGVVRDLRRIATA